MSLIDTLKKWYRILHFLKKPQQIDLFLFPQTVKAKDLEVFLDEETGLYFTKDDTTKQVPYIQQKVLAKEAVTMSDGQVFQPGDMVFFKLERISFDVLRECVDRVETKRGVKRVKTGIYYLTSTKVVGNYGHASLADKYLYLDIDKDSKVDFNKMLEDYHFNRNCSHYDHQTGMGLWGAKLNYKKQVTDFAIASGVKSRKGYGAYGKRSDETYMVNEKGKQVYPYGYDDDICGSIFHIYMKREEVDKKLLETASERAKRATQQQ